MKQQMPYTTLNELKKAGACKNRYNHLISKLPATVDQDDPILLTQILDINGLDDVLWIPESAVFGDKIPQRYLLFAVACCHEIWHLMVDQRSKDAIIAAHLYAHGEITQKELTAARVAARDAARDAAWAAAWTAAWDAARVAARDAARDAAWAAARAAARDAARVAAWDAARDAARAAAWAAASDAAFDAAFDAASDAASDAAWDAARDAASDAAFDAARANQYAVFKVIFSA